MRKRIATLIMATMLVLGITACGSSNTNTENAGNTISDAMTEEMEEVTPAPTEEPAPTPEPTATPEPTLAPIEWTTEEGTLLPTEPVVFIKGSAVKLPCTVEEFMARTGEKIFKSEVFGGYNVKNHMTVQKPTYDLELKVLNEDDDYTEYVIFSIHTQYVNDTACTDVTLPGDIYVGSVISPDELMGMWGLCDAPDCNILWWNIGDDNPGYTFDWDTCVWYEQQRLELSRGYMVNIEDGSNEVHGVEVNVSSDKLYELYGVR